MTLEHITNKERFKEIGNWKGEGKLYYDNLYKQALVEKDMYYLVEIKEPLQTILQKYAINRNIRGYRGIRS